MPSGLEGNEKFRELGVPQFQEFGVSNQEHFLVNFIPCSGAGGVAADDGGVRVRIDDPVGLILHPVVPPLVVARVPRPVVVPLVRHVELLQRSELF